MTNLKTNECLDLFFYDELKERLDFVQFLICNCSLDIKCEHLTVMWDCLVVNAFTDHEKDLFFSWLSSIIDSPSGKYG